MIKSYSLTVSWLQYALECSHAVVQFLLEKTKVCFLSQGKYKLLRLGQRS